MADGLLSPVNRQLLHEGRLSLAGATKLLDVHLFLFDDLLLITKVKNAKKVTNDFISDRTLQGGLWGGRGVLQSGVRCFMGNMGGGVGVFKGDPLGTVFRAPSNLVLAASELHLDITCHLAMNSLGF
ncbi:hypothetical protein chiPu_0025009 [Chiloscyllium punctatum]|uniref:Uncharacterized protein n=1 Tax=Chiloscyllium punctatum TaxID=137246 RepID=A0A401TFA3_CHIPU|nr:hypothetical protein [Chiloscyllium punctatum]